MITESSRDYNVISGPKIRGSHGWVGRSFDALMMIF
jgi:hypothetical protein